MRREFTIQSKVDGLVLDGLVVEPEEGVKRTALLQLSHGMSEYKERYLPFMEYMAEHGVVCVIHDHRGHGKSVKSDQDLGFMYGAGGAGLVEDLFLVTKWAKKKYPDLPFVLMGHSMGSLVVRAYAKEHDQELDALIVCGSPSKNYLRPLGAAVGHAEAAVLGDESIGAIFWRRCRLDRLRRGLRMRRAGSPGAVRTRRWCGSMKKIRSVDLHFRMMLFLR